MQLFKCDRCGKIVEAPERFWVHIGEDYADLCPQCYEEYKKEKESVDRVYNRNMHVLAVRYGLIKIEGGM